MSRNPRVYDENLPIKNINHPNIKNENPAALPETNFNTFDNRIDIDSKRNTKDNYKNKNKENINNNHINPENAYIKNNNNFNQPSEVYVHVVPVEYVEMPDTCYSDSMISFLLNLLFPFFGYIYYCCRLPFIVRKKTVFLFASLPIIAYILACIIWAIIYSTSHSYYYSYPPYYRA